MPTLFFYHSAQGTNRVLARGVLQVISGQDGISEAIVDEKCGLYGTSHAEDACNEWFRSAFGWSPEATKTFLHMCVKDNILTFKSGTLARDGGGGAAAIRDGNAFLSRCARRAYLLKGKGILHVLCHGRTSAWMIDDATATGYLQVHANHMQRNRSQAEEDSPISGDVTFGRFIFWVDVYEGSDIRCSFLLACYLHPSGVGAPALYPLFTPLAAEWLRNAITGSRVAPQRLRLQLEAGSLDTAVADVPKRGDPGVETYRVLAPQVAAAAADGAAGVS